MTAADIEAYKLQQQQQLKLQILTQQMLESQRFIIAATAQQAIATAPAIAPATAPAIAPAIAPATIAPVCTAPAFTAPSEFKPEITSHA